MVVQCNVALPPLLHDLHAAGLSTATGILIHVNAECVPSHASLLCE